MARLTQAKLEGALGGADKLRDLLDKNFDGVADVELVEQVIDAAEGEAASAIQVAVDLDDPRVDGSLVLEQRKLQLAVYWAYQKGTSGQAVPQDVREGYEDTLRWLDDVAKGTRTLGAARHPATSYPVEVVDIDPQQTRTTRRNMKGFC